jgi:hypothetical protein
MVLPDSRGIPRVPRYSGTASREIEGFRLRDYHPLWWCFPEAFDYHFDFVTPRDDPEAAPQPRVYRYTRFGLFPFRSPLLGESRLISLPRGTEMFHFPPFASSTYEFRAG